MPEFSILNDNKGGTPLLDLNESQGKGDVIVNRPQCMKCGEPPAASNMGRKYVALECKECTVFERGERL
jgi:hypothetical protein